jgi:hypothetical protein
LSLKKSRSSSTADPCTHVIDDTIRNLFRKFALEPILYGWRNGVDHFWCGARDQGDIWFIKRPMANVDGRIALPSGIQSRSFENQKMRMRSGPGCEPSGRLSGEL